MPSDDRIDPRRQSICAWCGCSFRADKFSQWGTWQIADIRNVVAPARSVYGASGRCFEQTYTGRFMPVTSMRRLTNFPTSKRLCGMGCYWKERETERALQKKGTSVDYPHWRPSSTPPGCRAYGAPIPTSTYGSLYSSSRSPSPSRQSGAGRSVSHASPSRARTGASEGSSPSRGRTSLGEAASPPSRGRTSLGEAASPPTRGRTSLGEAASPPSRGRTSLDQAASPPSRGRTSLGEAASPPSRGRTSLGEAASPPSRGRTSLGEAASPPSRARSSLGGPFLGTVSEMSRTGTQGEPKGAWLGLLSVVLLRGENLRLHYAGDLFASFDSEQTNPVCAISLNGRSAQRTGIIKEDTSPTFDEEFLFDLHERDARPEGLRVDVHWHDLKTGVETHIGFVTADTHDLFGAAPRQIVGRLENDRPGAVCRGTLTVEVRLLEAQDLPNRDLYEPKEVLPPWWLSQAGSRPETSYTSHLTRTPLRSSRSFLATPGGPPVSVSTVSVMPPSPRGEDAAPREPRQPPQEEHRYMSDREVKVRINVWDKTNTRKIIKVDRTGVMMGKLPYGGSKTVVPQEERIQARRNKLAKFFLERGQDRLAFEEVQRMRCRGYQVDGETDEAMERSYTHSIRWTPSEEHMTHKVEIYSFPTRSQTSPSKNASSGLGGVRSTTAVGASRPKEATWEASYSPDVQGGDELLLLSPSPSPSVNKRNSSMGGEDVGGRWSDKLDVVYDEDT